MKRNLVMLLGILLLGVVVLMPIGPLSWTDASNGRYRIEVILKVRDADYSFWDAVSDGVEAAARDFGVTTAVTGAASENDVDGQIAAVREAIGRHPDAIVLAALDYDRLAPVADEATAAGIRLITIDSGIRSGAAACHIATDNRAAGRTAGDCLSALVSEEGEVAVLTYVAGAQSLMDRDAGVRESLAAAGRGIVLDTFSAEAREDEAYRITAGLLRTNPALEAVAGLNETVSLGAARAILDAGRQGDVHLVAFDNAKQEVRYLEAGVIDALIVQKPFNMGYMGIRSAVRLLDGKTVEPFTDTGSVLITVDSMDTVENRKWLFPFVGKQSE